MSSINLSTALSGISAANERLRASASNVARLSVDGAGRARVDLSSTAEGGVSSSTRLTQQPIDPATEMVEQRSATYSFVANLRVLQTQLRAEGTLLDIHA